MFAAGKNRFAARMVSMEPLCNVQYLFQVLAQDRMVAIALRLTQGIANEILDHDRFFTVRFVLRRMWLEIESDGASCRGLKLCQLANFFTCNHSLSLICFSFTQPGSGAAG